MQHNNADDLMSFTPVALNNRLFRYENNCLTMSALSPNDMYTLWVSESESGCAMAMIPHRVYKYTVDQISHHCLTFTVVNFSRFVSQRGTVMFTT